MTHMNLLSSLRANKKSLINIGEYTDGHEKSHKLLPQLFKHKDDIPSRKNRVKLRTQEGYKVMNKKLMANRLKA
jgi:hypothetical protein